jgi:hypothetical protein
LWEIKKGAKRMKVERTEQEYMDLLFYDAEPDTVCEDEDATPKAKDVSEMDDDMGCGMDMSDIDDDIGGGEIDDAIDAGAAGAAGAAADAGPEASISDLPHVPFTYPGLQAYFTRSWEEDGNSTWHLGHYGTGDLVELPSLPSPSRYLLAFDHQEAAFVATRYGGGDTVAHDWVRNLLPRQLHGVTDIHEV